MNSRYKPSRKQPGFSMIEVLVTLIILLVGLLGLAALMAQGQRSEMESYQRVQALTLLQDMAGRINANRNVARCYAFTVNADGTPNLGTSPAYAPACAVDVAAVIPTATAAQIAQAVADMTAWNDLLLGATETTDAGSNKVGVMIGARGCVSYDGVDLVNGIPGTGIYTIAVAWQGLGETAAPPASASPAMNCGSGDYGAETRRRVVSLTLRIGSLAAI